LIAKDQALKVIFQLMTKHLSS